MPRSQIEFRLAVFVADCLRRDCSPGIVWTHFPAGEKRPTKVIRGKRFSPAAARLKRMGTRPGVADYLFVTLGAEVAWLELKAPNGYLSKEQRDFRDDVTTLGCRYAVARTGQEAIEILRDWGIMRKLRVSA